MFLSVRPDLSCVTDCVWKGQSLLSSSPHFDNSHLSQFDWAHSELLLEVFKGGPVPEVPCRRSGGDVSTGTHLEACEGRCCSHICIGSRVSEEFVCDG